MVPLKNILYLQSNWNYVTECLTSSMGVLTFLKGTDSPGLQTSFGGLWTCAHGAGGPLCEVFCTGNSCTGFSVIGAGPLVGVVVLKEGCGPGS